MPELPEVETVRRGLADVMDGRTILRAEARRPDLRWPLPDRLAERLAGARVIQLRRRSKYILADLDSGETLLLHLGMSGRIVISHGGARDTLGTFVDNHPAPARHDHVVIDLATGVRVTFNDPRRFGSLDLIASGAADTHRLLAKLGPEPLGNGFHEAYLAGALRRRSTSLKAALLDQTLVAGLGNIYVCEALHRTGISPRRRSDRLSAARAGTLVPAIRAVLLEAIEAGGSSLRDYRRTDGELGYFQHAFRVYGRAGAACTRPGCPGSIRRIVQAGRSSFYCTSCQR